MQFKEKAHYIPYEVPSPTVVMNGHWKDGSRQIVLVESPWEAFQRSLQRERRRGREGTDVK